MINYDLDEGYLVEDLSKYYNSSTSSSTTSNFNTNLVISTLIVEAVHKKHLGNYSCSPSNAKSAQVTVHVLHGKWVEKTIIYSRMQMQKRRTVTPPPLIII